MNRWAIYDSEGRIDRVYFGPASEAAIQPQGSEQAIALPEQFSDINAYVTGGEVIAKQALSLQITSTQITANGTDETIITNIPAGTTVEWPDGQTDEVTDGEVRFSVDLPGTYTLKFSAIPYLDQEVVIEAVAPA